MSGIVGFAGVNLKQVRSALLSKMATSIKHLESDLIDKWGDGYLDVARVHHGVVNTGRQPIFNEDGSLMIVMDGEVYDYNDVKQKLALKGYRFRYDDNDAEFCLHLYEEMGKDAFRELNGSFLILIYDLAQKKIIIVNDRFASRPLYYYICNQFLIFSTEVKAIIQCDQVPKILDRRSVLEFFTFRRILGTKTYYQNIQAMPPATILCFQGHKWTLNRYWKINFQEGRRKPQKYYVDILVDTLIQAVKRRTRDNYQYGIFLSGGLDSRTVLAAVPSDRSITAFTMGDWENRELNIARAIAAAKGIEHYFLKRWPDYCADLAFKVSELSEGMWHFDTGTPIGLIDEIRSRGVDILLHGYGLDFKFQGLYLPEREINVLNKKVRLPLLASISNKDELLAKDILNKLKYVSDKRIINRLFNKNFLNNLKSWPIKSVRIILGEADNYTKNPYNKWDYFISHFCSKHYTYIFELEIRNYIEERTIIFDNDLLAAYLEIPPDLRFGGKIYRKALSKIDPKIAAIPNANTGLSPNTAPLIEFGVKLSKKVLEKIGIKIPVPDPTYTHGSWPNIPELMRYNEKLRKLIWDTILDDESIDPAIFNKSFLKEMFNKHMNRKKVFSSYLLLILSFGMWYKQSGLNCNNG